MPKQAQKPQKSPSQDVATSLRPILEVQGGMGMQRNRIDDPLPRIAQCHADLAQFWKDEAAWVCSATGLMIHCRESRSAVQTSPNFGRTRRHGYAAQQD